MWNNEKIAALIQKRERAEQKRTNPLEINYSKYTLNILKVLKVSINDGEQHYIIFYGWSWNFSPNLQPPSHIPITPTLNLDII